MSFQNNKKEFRFELIPNEGTLAFLSYRWLKGRMVLLHTFVPEQLRGTGKGEELVRLVLEYARKEGLKVIVYCPFVAAFLHRHPEFEDVAAP